MDRFRLAHSTLLLCIAAATLSARDARAVDLSWNGFASVYGILPLEKNISEQLPENTGGHLTFSDGSKIGLNVQADLGEGWSAMAQFLASGSNYKDLGATPSWSPRADWYYLVYAPTDELRIKIGRQIFPAWLVSEFIDVGYTYPWRRPPGLAYNAEIYKSFTGASADYRIALSSSTSLVASLFGGGDKSQWVWGGASASSNIEVSDLVGGTLTLDGDGWRVRGMAARQRESSQDTYYPGGGTNLSYVSYEFAPLVTTYTFGGRYDKNNIVAYAEYGMERSSGATIVPDRRTPYVGKVWGTYGTLGYRLHRWLPWYTASYGDWKMGYAGTNGEALQHSVGLNYQASRSVITKIQYDRQQSVHDSVNLSRVGTADSLSFGVDAVF